MTNGRLLTCPGSSGGTTAVVAMRMAAAGFCSDTGTSYRICNSPILYANIIHIMSCKQK